MADPYMQSLNSSRVRLENDRSRPEMGSSVDKRTNYLKHLNGVCTRCHTGVLRYDIMVATGKLLERN